MMAIVLTQIGVDDKIDPEKQKMVKEGWAGMFDKLQKLFSAN